jgi:hypothetical protein
MAKGKLKRTLMFGRLVMESPKSKERLLQTGPFLNRSIYLKIVRFPNLFYRKPVIFRVFRARIPKVLAYLALSSHAHWVFQQTVSYNHSKVEFRGVLCPGAI